MLDGKRLRFFLVIAEEASMNRAAERLNIAQSALSRHMKTLEDELGFPLFERTSAGSRLTAAGKAFRQDAKNLLVAFDRAALKARRIATGASGKLRIGLNEVAAGHPAVLDKIAAFRDSYPDIDIHIDFIYSTDQAEKIESDEIDAGIMFHPPDSPKFALAPIGAEEARLLVPASHPLARRKRIRMRDLQSERFIVYNPMFNQRYMAAVFESFYRNGIAPNVYQEANSEHQMIQMVSLGIGVAFVYGSNGARDRPNVVVKTVEDLTAQAPQAMVWLAGNKSPQLQHFCRLFS